MRLVVARIGRAHGIRGEVTVQVHTDEPDRRFVPGARLFVMPGRGARPQPGLPGELTLATARDHNGTLLLAFDEIADRTAAEALRDLVLEMDVQDDPGDDDAWYDHQLVGLAVVDPAGAALGDVVAVEHLPAQDLLVVRTGAGDRRLVPFVRAIVPEVDVPAGRVVVDAPAGLLADLPEDDEPEDGEPEEAGA